MNYLIVGDPSGCHCLQLMNRGVSVDDITVWEDTPKGINICRNRGVRVVSDLEDLNGMKFSVIVGNPPYGNGGNLAIKFLNKCGDLSDDIRFILPTSIRKPSSQNKVRLDLECVDDTTLPDGTFPRGIKAVCQRWVKTDTPRNKIQTHTTHPDFVFCDRLDPSANVFVMRVGANAGWVKINEFEHYRSSSTSHFFLRVNDQTVIDRLMGCELDYRETAKQTNGMPVLSKHELIQIYNEE